MATIAQKTVSTIVPCLRYRDAPAAITWLCQVFGFERHLVVPNEDGGIAHAQLTFGNGMVMLGSVLDTPFGRLMRQPDQVDGAETQSPYLVAADADAVCARQGGRRADRDGHQGRRLRRARVFLPGPGRASVERRHLRPLGGDLKLAEQIGQRLAGLQRKHLVQHLQFADAVDPETAKPLA